MHWQVIHDWGGMIGQVALETLSGSLKRLVVLNTFVGPGFFAPTGIVCFFIWQGLVRIFGRGLPIAEVCAADAGGPKFVSAKAEAGFGAPFPSGEYKGLAAIWPLFYCNRSLVVKKYGEYLEWSKDNLKVPILVAFSTEDKFMDYTRAYKFFTTHMKAAPSIQQVLSTMLITIAIITNTMIK